MMCKAERKLSERATGTSLAALWSWIQWREHVKACPTCIADREAEALSKATGETK